MQFALRRFLQKTTGVRSAAQYIRKTSNMQVLAATGAENMAEQPTKIRKFGNDVLRVKKLTELATLPVRGSAGAAGYDLASAYDVVIPARGKGIAKTDLAIAIPSGTYARVAPRSGLAVKNFIDVGAGVVDEDYRGNVGVVLFNHSDVDFEVKKGDRVAQLILERIMTPEVQECEELDDTSRGAAGYGSTGVQS